MKKYVLYFLSYFFVAFLITIWFFAWVWLFKNTNKIERKSDRFKYALGHGICLLILPILSAVCCAILFDMDTSLGLLLGLFLTFISFAFWDKSSFATHQTGKTFNRRFIISFFLMLAFLISLLLYIATNASCCSITVASPDGGYEDTFAKDTNK